MAALDAKHCRRQNQRSGSAKGNALSARDIACAVLAAAAVSLAAHMFDRVAFGLAMEQRGLASHQLADAAP